MISDNEKEYRKSTGRQDIYTDSSAEYVIPDYNGDIRKLLLCDAEVHPSGRFASDGELELSGVVVYNIVYSDPDGRIDSASFSSEYEYKTKCTQESYIDSVEDTRVANVSVRLIGPRKISAKASLVGSVTLIESAELEVSGTALEENAGAELLESKLSVRNSVNSEYVEREYAETVASLDGAIADEVRVLYSGAYVDIDDDYEIRDGALHIEGELTLFALVRDGEESVRLYEKEVDIEQDIPFEGASADMKFIPKATVVSQRDSINATDTGTDVVLSVIVEYSALGEGNKTVSAVRDAYLKECMTENIYDDFSYTTFVDKVSAKSEFEGSAERGALDVEHIREIAVLVAQAKVESVNASGKDAEIRGEIRFSGIASCVADDGTVTYSPVKFSSEFAKNVNLNCQTNDKMHIKPSVSLTNVRGYVDAEHVYGAADMNITLSIYEQCTERVLASCEAREDLPFESHSSVVSVYYPTPGETLFSVAKRFHTTPSKLALDNSVTAQVSAGDKDSLLGVKRLVIY